MELRHCNYFLALNEEGSFTRAAAKLGISQPSLSQQMRQLEKILGVQLFDRMGRTIRLTAAGEVFIPYAQNLLKISEHARNEVNGVQGLSAGRLRIACIPSLERFVCSAVAKFVNKYPRMKIQVHQRHGRKIDEMILAGDVDLALAVRRNSPPDINIIPLYREHYVVTYREDHPLRQTEISKLSGIGSTPFAMFCFGSYSRDATDAYLRPISFWNRSRSKICYELRGGAIFVRFCRPVRCEIAMGSRTRSWPTRGRCGRLRCFSIAKCTHPRPCVNSPCC